MTNLFTHIDKCLLKWIWFNTNRRYKWHCCLLLFLAWLITESVENDAFRTFTSSMQQCIVYMTNKIRIILINFRFQIGNDRQSKDYMYLQTWGEFFFFIFLGIKTGIRDFLLDIYFAYKSCVWTTALGLEFSGSNDIVFILPLY